VEEREHDPIIDGSGWRGSIERTSHCQPTALKDVGIDHSCLDILVAQEFLDRSDVVAVGQKVSGEAVAQGMRCDMFVNAGFEGSSADRLLDHPRVYVVPPKDPGPNVSGQAGGRKGVLPDPARIGLGVFAREGMRKVDRPVTLGQILSVDQTHDVQVAVQVGQQAFGQDGRAVVIAFGVANGDLFEVKVQILHSQAEALHTCTCAALRRKCRC
jgi:hypothetical protein